MTRELKVLRDPEERELLTDIRDFTAPFYVIFWDAIPPTG